MKLNNIDFTKLYEDGILEYVQRRDPTSFNAKRIALEVTFFKIPNLLSVIPDNFDYESVLEIGCATGELISNFPGKHINRRVGYDLSDLNIKVAASRFPNTSFFSGDFRSCSDFYDLVILSDILEHVPDDVQFLREAGNLGRVILINLPLEKCLGNLLIKCGPSHPSGHLRKYSLNDGLRLINRAGLNVIRCNRQWVMESDYEAHRLQLNKEMFGVEFRGGAPVRLAKHLVYHLCAFSNTIGRLIFPSNLFVSARKPYE